MKKVLIIGMTENVGGIEKYILGIIKNAPKNQYCFDVLDSCQQGKSISFSKELIENGCNIIKITNRKNNYFNSYKELKNVIIQNNYDIIHYHLMSYKWFEPIIISQKVNAKLIVHCHIDPKTINYGFFGNIINNIGKIMIKNVPMTRVACGKLCGNNFFNNKKFEVVYNGINLEKFKFSKEKRDKIRKEYKIPESTFVLCNVARFTHQKNLGYLFDIFEAYNSINDNSMLLLVGDGEERKEIEKRIKNDHLENKVILPGIVSNVSDFYSAADIFVMPSLYEGFSISIVEAQASGLHCLTSNMVDEECNILGNVDFLSIRDQPLMWVKRLSEIERIDRNNIKLPDNFDAKKSYQKLYEIYDK